jgi:hypothetical protein
MAEARSDLEMIGNENGTITITDGTIRVIMSIRESGRIGGAWRVDKNNFHYHNGPLSRRLRLADLIELFHLDADRPFADEGWFDLN